MTRFARAKGSKSSNERREEEATPWHVMRQQLVDQLGNSRPQNSTNLSYNVKEILNGEAQSKKEEVWSDFGEIKSSHKNPSKVLKKKLKSDKKKLSQVIGNQKGNGFIEASIVDVHRKSKSQNAKKYPLKPDDSFVGTKMKNLKHNNNLNFTDDSPGSTSESTDTTMKLTIEKNVKKPKVENFGNDTLKSANLSCNKKQKKISKSNKVSAKLVNSNDSSTVSRNCTEVNSLTFNNSSSSHMTAADKNPAPFKEFKQKSLNSNEPYTKSGYCGFNYNYSSNSKGFDNGYTIVANGREIKVVTFEGFLVKQDDAAELKKLRKKLKAQNFPKEEIKRILKLERRKAEKSLTREKKKVCFHCRRFGHNFSDCPDITDSELAKSGMCFKCGSLEHSYFQCKVLQSQDFRHAVCFVCREQGHIARQCPLNSQGQYPKGGCCHLCGEVTHLRKDCPKAADEKTSTSFTIETLTKNNVESISDKKSHEKVTDPVRKKVIQF